MGNSVYVKPLQKPIIQTTKFSNEPMCKIQDTNIVAVAVVNTDPVVDVDANNIQIKNDLYDKQYIRHVEKFRNIHMELKNMKIIENDDISFMTNETSNLEKILLLQTYSKINNMLISYIIDDF